MWGIIINVYLNVWVFINYVFVFILVREIKMRDIRVIKYKELGVKLEKRKVKC